MALEEIRKAYKLLGADATFYDGMITCSTVPGRAVCRLVWDMGRNENSRYIQKALAGIPENFSGKLLEVPVGTGVLTMPVYRTWKNAEITCVDYSKDMMFAARKRAERLEVPHIHFLQGDVGDLHFEDGSFDIVLSLNGFHAFPNKEAAFSEVFRVLKVGGTFCGCFYIQGENTRTDWFIRNFYEPKGFFTPPYETAASLENRLKGSYSSVMLETVKSMACFCCHK